MVLSSVLGDNMVFATVAALSEVIGWSKRLLAQLLSSIVFQRLSAKALQILSSHPV
jgi:xanthine/uracil/vitamin C permease (AzgA family)